MLRKCKCGKLMDIRLRTVIYSDHVEILNVPVYTCKPCKRSIVCAEAKPDIKTIVHELGEHPSEQTINFCDYNEIAKLLFMASDEDRIHTPLTDLVNERINELLDLMIIAKTTQDERWQEEIEKKLLQVTTPYVLTTSHPEHNEI